VGLICGRKQTEATKTQLNVETLGQQLEKSLIQLLKKLNRNGKTCATNTQGLIENYQVEVVEKWNHAGHGTRLCLSWGVVQRKEISNLVDDSQNVEANEEQSDQKSEADDSASRTETPKSSKSTESKITKKRPAPTDAVDSAIIQYLTNKKDKSDDEDMLFAKSIGTSIAKLPPRIKRRVKIGIMQLINQAEEEHEQEAAATYTRPITFTSQPIIVKTDDRLHNFVHRRWVAFDTTIKNLPLRTHDTKRIFHYSSSPLMFVFKLGNKRMKLTGQQTTFVYRSDVPSSFKLTFLPSVMQ
uniref:BESS domain-containing protein n=1 Tax=Romanomermis culicivorax TaxID=13658 RepID=A0A915IG14_ROMCU